ncbi:maleylpyruvate isomerase family mycothiol-dependent enzyme [Glaciibacter flavus]|uniref:maleylpyruvate isomerase family mycothiol-dependent enzyme n=1 Tax=Orlajensenia flava TaxID=2565934 RepID=UPI003AFFAC1E
MTDASDGSGDAQMAPVLEALERETTSLLDAVLDEFLEIDLQGQPVIADFTGGHVLTHLAREADLMADDLLAATGREVPPPDADRQWSVDYGADRPGAVLIDDVTRSSERLRDALQGVDDWSSLSTPARDIPARRLTQLLVHRADLGRSWEAVREGDAALVVSWLPVLLPAELAGIRLVTEADEPLVSERTDESSTVVRGDSRSLLAWVSGRRSGAVETGSGPPGITQHIWF